MSHVVASYVCRKNIFYNQTSLKGFRTFSTISLAFSIASVIPALLNQLLPYLISSPIPSGGLEIPLLLKFSCLEQKTFEKIKKNNDVIGSLYDYYNSGVNNEEREDEEEAAIAVETGQLLWQSTSTLMIILMKELTWSIINFLFWK